MRCVPIKFVLLAALIISCADSLFAQSDQCSRGKPFRLVFVGDSLVSGQGDGEQLGGFVGRLQLLFPQFEIRGISFPGANSQLILDYFGGLGDLQRRDAVLERLRGADLIVIVAGTNDFWFDRIPKTVYQNLVELRGVLQHFLAQPTSLFPVIRLSALSGTNRKVQHFWVYELNRLIQQKKGDYPMSFQSFSPEQFSPDGVHPNSAGYSAMTEDAANYLLKLRYLGVACTPRELSELSGELCSINLTTEERLQADCPRHHSTPEGRRFMENRRRMREARVREIHQERAKARAEANKAAPEK